MIYSTVSTRVHDPLLAFGLGHFFTSHMNIEMFRNESTGMLLPATIGMYHDKVQGQLAPISMPPRCIFLWYGLVLLLFAAAGTEWLGSAVLNFASGRRIGAVADSYSC